MRFIPTKIHGLLDYVIGLILIGSPWIFAFAAGGAETALPVILGFAIVLYSLLTRYEWGAVGVIAMPSHLWIDALAGVILAVSPWLFGFAAFVWGPHLVLGILTIVAASMSERLPRAHREPYQV